ncbi:MAG: UbiD family decarboxylase, partial [Acidimicrobiia bacterium]|nr:UbiD family decarboxylase [Acidimicrobiia bacterium]
MSLGDWLDGHGPELSLVRVQNQVDPSAYEATAFLARLESRDPIPPVLFESLSNLQGLESGFRMVFNAYASYKSVITALGSHAAVWRELLAELPKLTSDLKPMQVVDQGIVQTNVFRDEMADLRILPWTRHVEGEGGAYFTPIVVSREPNKPRYNLSWNRVMYLDRRHAGVHISPRQLWAFQRVAEESGQDLPVALVLGHHPAFNLAAASLTAMAVDEYEVAGALLGESV